MALLDVLTLSNSIVCDLPKSGQFMLKLREESFAGATESNASFAFISGVPCVHIGALEPLPGSSYRTFDTHGLFWSRTPVAKQPTNPSSAKAGGGVPPSVFQLSLHVANQIVDQTQVALSYGDLAYEAFDLSNAPFVGTLLYQRGARKRPTVVVCGGSEGGQDRTTSAMFASHNFTVLSLAYFNVTGLPPSLTGVDLEYFEKAVQWLKERPEVGSKVAFYGTSRGGELAVQLASTYGSSGLFDAIVSKSGGGVRFDGSWKLDGKTLPSVSDAEDDKCRADVSAFDIRLQSPLSIECALDREAAHLDEFVIDLTSNTTPLLMLSGSADLVWNSQRLFEYALKRVSGTAAANLIRQVTFFDAGHMLYPSYYMTAPPAFVIHPIFHYKLYFGGSRDGNALANARVAHVVLEFFEQHQFFD